MRKAVLILTLLVAVAVTAAPAIAGGKAHAAKAPTAKTSKKPAGCKAVVAYVAVGTVASVGVDSVTVDVVETNRHALAFGTPMTFGVDATTKVSRDDAGATLADLQVGDSLTVQARACKGADPVATSLVARHVSAAAPAVEEPVV